MTPQQWAQAIAIIESSNRSNPPLGDSGRALGRYQMWPSWVFEWAKRLNLYPTVNETWDAYFTRLIQGYFTFRTKQGLTPVQAAVSFHRGHVVKEGDPDWLADDYAERFNAASIQAP